MPRPMIGNQNDSQTYHKDRLDLTGGLRQKPQTQQIDKFKMDKLLRRPRSKAYMDAIHSLDAGGHVRNQEKVNEMIKVIQNEFPEISISGILLGYVSKCYLGKPYEVHTLDIAGEIITHYEAGHRLPGDMEKARSIAIRGGYAFIEVYTDCLRAVSSNGTVSNIPRN